MFEANVNHIIAKGLECSFAVVLGLGFLAWSLALIFCVILIKDFFE